MSGGRVNNKIRVGFFPPFDTGWMGGVNYYKNLFYAIKNYASNEIEIIVFLPYSTDVLVLNKYQDLADECYFVGFLDNKKLAYLFSKVEMRILKTNRLLEFYLRRYNIDLISHSGFTGLKKIKALAWIPDFQHLHLPSMFTAREIKVRNGNFKELARSSNAVVLSSFDALKDFETFAFDKKDKARVLQFVSQPDDKYFLLDVKDQEKILTKYDLPNDFYYLPNQFWKHKNHIVAFDAVRLLKEEGKDICLVCSGNLRDYRSPEYIRKLQDYIADNKLERNIRLLGVVPYEEVFSLIKFSRAVINPSLFEGWSSTVEECKSVNKNMILSDLKVHKEQSPDAVFFQRNSADELKIILQNYRIPVSAATESVANRTKKFAQRYVDIVKDL